VETCTNCNRAIGNLETPHLYEGHIVCADCYQRLEAEHRTRALGYASTTPGSGQDGKALAGLVLGLVGLFAWCLPIVGLPVGVIGIVMGAKGLKSNRRGMAMAGLILSSICVVLALVNAAIGAYLGATGQLFKH
jgi:hypothetical protein